MWLWSPQHLILENWFNVVRTAPLKIGEDGGECRVGMIYRFTCLCMAQRGVGSSLDNCGIYIYIFWKIQFTTPKVLGVFQFEPQSFKIGSLSS
jgi:hypothetical protein